VSDAAPVEVSLHIEAEPETVFPYFTDPSRYVQWMGTEADLDPAPGGIYRVRMREGIETVGEFLEVDPPHRVVFTFGWTEGMPVPPGTSRVVVTLEPEAGGTRVVLRHHGLPDDEQREHHTQGWQMYFERLASAVAGEDAGPDPNS